MDIWYVLANCGWQLLVASVLLVQFFTILWLRRRVRDLAQYEYWYFQTQQQSSMQPPMQSRSLRRPAPRRHW